MVMADTYKQRSCDLRCALLRIVVTIFWSSAGEIGDRVLGVACFCAPRRITESPLTGRAILAEVRRSVLLPDTA